MKKLFLLMFLLLSVFIYPQQIKYDCVLMDKNVNYFTKVSAPKIFSERNVLSKTATSSFQVATWTGNWPDQAKVAFNYAVDIWKYLINSSLPIKIEAEWKALGANSGILASTFPLSYKRNFTNAPMTDVNYPIALAEALCETELNGSENEIHINVNSDISDNWYYGTDGNTPSGKTDLSTVILHEIVHGLGLIHSSNVENNIGSWGTAYKEEGNKGFAQVFEKFDVVGSNSTSIYRLTNTNQYANPSSDLGAVLTCNNIYFDGTNSKSMNSNMLPKLYAPAAFSSGSSIAHLDENAFPEGNNNSLFSPQLGKAESIHSPGEIGLALLQDLGWTVNRIITISSPTPGVAYMPGQTKTITWTDNIGGAISIDLLKKDAFGNYVKISTIASHSSPKGIANSISWTVPNDEGTFKIRIIDNSTEDGYGISNPFIISSQAQVLAPVLNPSGGNYSTAQSVTITCSTSRSEIRYTLDGNEPTSSSTSYSSAILISESKTLKAKAFKTNYPESETTTGVYYIGDQIMPATMDLGSGTFYQELHITVTCQSGTQAFYTCTENGLNHLPQPILTTY